MHLRGGRYLISSNPTFELRQKIATFKEDLDEGIDAIQKTRKQVYQLGIADYIKNSIITMLNAFLYDEKIGKYRHDNLIYQSLRADAQEYGQAAVDFFYGILLQAKQLTNDGFRLLVENRNVFDKIQNHIVEQYQQGVFSSRHITRPEASHPLVIAAAVLQYSNFGNNEIDTIVGLPSGSTELGFAHAVGQRLFKRKRCEVLLFPVSLHSAKNDFDKFAIKPNTLSRYTRHNRGHLKDKRILIVDDNSSTGRTIQLVADAFSQANPRSIDVAVAEADIVRSQIDLKDSNRTAVASASLYSHSINILPVSHSLFPKTDIRELLEKRKMIACTKARYGRKDGSYCDDLVGQVYMDMLDTPTEKILSDTEPSQIIRSFQKTFLSNFYLVEVFYNRKRFSSVEHAYQAMKFDPENWSRINQADVDYINKKLKSRGASISSEDLPNMFTLPEITAGTSKIAANCLRIRGYVRNDWDDIKAVIMAELLIQKFAKPEFWQLLKETGNKYLIEGNDWNDTYWGECNGRGRNVLGRMLMAIRATDYNIIKEEAGRLVQQHRPT